MEVHYQLNRDHYNARTTLGILNRPDGSKFGYVLEDTVRPYGIKVKKETAIPATGDGELYFMEVRKSSKYGEVVVVFTRKEGDVYILEHDGKKFEYILCHAGNKHEHTEGCLLVNENRDVKAFSAWGGLKDEILQEVKHFISEGFTVRLKINNGKQVN